MLKIILEALIIPSFIYLILFWGYHFGNRNKTELKRTVCNWRGGEWDGVIRHKRDLK